LVWLGFVAALVVLVLVGAEFGLRMRRGWVAAHFAVPEQDDPRFVADPVVRYRNRTSYAYESDASDPQRRDTATIHSVCADPKSLATSRLGRSGFSLWADRRCTVRWTTNLTR
jgi:hypothetical protein